MAPCGAPLGAGLFPREPCRRHTHIGEGKWRLATAIYVGKPKWLTYYLDLHSTRKAQSVYNHHCVKTLMEGPGSIRSKTMVVAVDGPHGVPWGGRGLGMLGNLLYYLDCTLKIS